MKTTSTELGFFSIETVISRIITTTQHVVVVASQNERFSSSIYTSAEHKREGSMKQMSLYREKIKKKGKRQE
jgi:hypothetical protein